ncbi:Lrp/AsnC family transcriptional regulator [Vreelandella alkaliphila]|uniref:Lrp/AsnC family transcriptional regulator n=1 Tax=Vreelandella alkaliphila TaxID=272774 RepID=UPI00232C475A|nr:MULTISPECIES: Lrp/AsnC family transcriptional regulator [Halomonas]
MSALDKKDARLATLLQADGRVSNARLAEQLHQHSEATTAEFERIIQASSQVLSC